MEIPCLICDRKHVKDAGILTRTSSFKCEECGSYISAVLNSPTLHKPHVIIRHSSEGRDTDIKLVVADSGVWHVDSDAEHELVETLEFDSDRAAALICASIVENRLEQAITSEVGFVPRIKERFKPSGPFGSFSVKIDLAHMLGLISKDAYHDLIVIKDIRNLFAHNLRIRHFETQSIRDKAKGFSLLQTHVGERGGEVGSPVAKLDLGLPRIFVPGYQTKKDNARDRYMMTVQVISFSLTLGRFIAKKPFV